jgi:hypothetical protein
VGPKGLGKLKKKLNSRHLVSNPRPSGLQQVYWVLRFAFQCMSLDRMAKELADIHENNLMKMQLYVVTAKGNPNEREN